MYVEADLVIKERALARLKQPEIKHARERAPKALLTQIHRPEGSRKYCRK